jgi:anaerobic dimethyl sulfoxide reductase subunit A
MYLQALTGNTMAPGGTAASQTGVLDGHAGMPMPNIDLHRAPGTYEAPVKLCMFKWLKAIELHDKLDSNQITREEYNNIIGNVADSEPPNIQMVILQSNNHLNSLPDINSGIKALQKVGFTVVFSHYADMPSARYADILLPQMATAFEGRDLGGYAIPAIRPLSLFRYGKNPSNYITYCQKCVDAPGEIKPAEWIWLQVAKRLGMAEAFSPRLLDVPDDQWDDVVEGFHKEGYEKWAQRKEIAPLNPLSWEEFQKKPVFRWEIDDPYHAFKGELKRGENPFKKTPSGKLEFYSAHLAKGPEYMASHEYTPGKGRCYGKGNLPPMAQMTMGGKNTFYSKDTEKYPLLMSSCHSLYRVHSFLDNQALLRDCYRHAVWMNLADAKQRGIKDDEMVRVFNDMGEMILPGYVTSRLVPGTVCIFHGSWYQPGEKKTELMPNGIDLRGSPNILIPLGDLPDTIIGHFPCKGLVQVEKQEVVR